VQAVVGAAALIPASLLPALLAPAQGAVLFLIASSLLGLAQFAIACQFCLRRDDVTARRLLRASLIYLPSWFLLLMLIPWVR
jgi:protoheme IX farnesyltransferase